MLGFILYNFMLAIVVRIPIHTYVQLCTCYRPMVVNSVVLHRGVNWTSTLSSFQVHALTSATCREKIVLVCGNPYQLMCYPRNLVPRSWHSGISTATPTLAGCSTNDGEGLAGFATCSDIPGGWEDIYVEVWHIPRSHKLVRALLITATDHGSNWAVNIRQSWQHF